MIVIEKVENMRDMTYDFYITLFGFIRIKRVLYHEQVVVNLDMPFWFRASKWLLRATCKHSWNKGKVYRDSIFLDDFNTYYKRCECKFCGKERIINLGSFEMYPHF